MGFDSTGEGGLRLIPPVGVGPEGECEAEEVEVGVGEALAARAAFSIRRDSFEASDNLPDVESGRLDIYEEADKGEHWLSLL